MVEKDRSIIVKKTNKIENVISIVSKEPRKSTLRVPIIVFKPAD